MPAADSTLSRPMAVADSTSPRPVPPEILHNNNPQPGHNMPHYWPQGTASLPPHVTVSEQFMRRMETVVSRVDMKFITENVINAIKDIPSPKNPLAKRQRGNRLVFCVAKHLGEENFD